MDSGKSTLLLYGSVAPTRKQLAVGPEIRPLPPGLCPPGRDDSDSAHAKPQAPGSSGGYRTPLVAAAKSGATGRQVFCVLLACHVNTLCGHLACFKKRPKWFCNFGGIFGAACRTGRRSLRNTAHVSLGNATLATLINHLLSAGDM